MVALLALPLVACGAADDDTTGAESRSASPSSDPAAEQRYPDVIGAVLRPVGDGTYDVEVTISSPYDTPHRYADGWRILSPDDTVLGTHDLTHDHGSEQPFTRTQTGLRIPDDVAEVIVEGHDQRYGYGGATVTVEVPAS